MLPLHPSEALLLANLRAREAAAHRRDHATARDRFVDDERQPEAAPVPFGTPSPRPRARRRVVDLAR